MAPETPSPEQKLPDPPYSRKKDPYAEPPVKDFSHLLSGEPAARPKRHRLRWLIVCLVILVVVGGSVGAYLMTSQHKATHTKHAPVKTATTTKTATIAMTSATSSTFGVTFSYPTNWILTGTNTTSMTITSPTMQLTSPSGQKINGKIVVAMQQQGQLSSLFTAGQDLAVLPSQIISYNDPGTDQTAQTYVSFVQYSTATVVGTLDAIYVTGNYGYQQSEVIPSSDMNNLNPLITVTFEQCNDAACSKITNGAVNASMWNETTLSTPVEDIIKSLSFS